MKQISLKLGNMRKAETFIVYPDPIYSSEDKVFRLQSDHRCVVIYPHHKKAVVGKYRAAYPTFLRDCGEFALRAKEAKVIDIADAVIEEIKSIQLKSRDAIIPGVAYIA